ncbi:nitrate reductase molybdenum cofactor assembly chaperone [Chelativorans intermedius]|uniref:Nitrate reductase molybdenum cofactor assembly chaperone n=1 Tax=Chelativorans intermedius TaxID=515947 RepID=A0ABV6DCX6_9HYPH|nr:nitrate reductase molybdenum cofactor assembly chaperone [Chelativorans intermedius]MCT9000518.1 nitrate reductase molybdenum cofactor assembly chaperone [Chelativorans intermedius]
MKTFKALSALLSYPTPDLLAALPDIESALREEGLLARGHVDALCRLSGWMAGSDIYELQEAYVQLFDRSRALSLNLFEHVHGESRDRGQAMVDLKALYARHGLEMAPGELPDFLPLFLEFLSILPLQEATAHLSEAAHIVAALHDRLEKRKAPQAAVLAAIADLAGTGEQVPLVDHEDAHPDDLAALDAAWEETAVTFGAGEALDGCSRERLAARLRAHRRDAAAADIMGDKANV